MRCASYGVVVGVLNSLQILFDLVRAILLCANSILKSYWSPAGENGLYRILSINLIFFPLLLGKLKCVNVMYLYNGN